MANEPPPNTEQDGDRRWYVHPLPPHERFVSVTTALDIFGSEALVFWATGLSAQAAFTELPSLVAATIRPLCGRHRNRCEHDFRERCDRCPCGECRDCVTLFLANRHFAESSRRADEGKRVHKAIEWWTLHGTWQEIEPELQPYITKFRRFVDDYGLTPDSWELSEATVLNREHVYAGTLDGHLRVRSGVTELADDFCARLGHPGADVLVTLDIKTKEKEGDSRIWPDHAMQLTAYRRGEVVMLRDGTEYPLPETDGAAVLQLRPDGAQLKPVRSDDEVFAAFLRALGLFQDLESANTWVSIRSFPLPEQYKKDKANRKARERRAAAKASKVAGKTNAAVPMQAVKPKLAKPPTTVHADPGPPGCGTCGQPYPDGVGPGDPCLTCGTLVPRPAKAVKKKAARKSTATTGQRLGTEHRTPVAAQVADPWDLLDQIEDLPF